MSEADLREALDDKTLAEIAKEKGKSVSGLVKALVAAEEKKIDEAVADGRITKAQASELKSRLAERMQALVNGELREHGERLATADSGRDRASRERHHRLSAARGLGRRDRGVRRIAPDPWSFELQDCGRADCA